MIPVILSVLICIAIVVLVFGIMGQPDRGYGGDDR